MVNNLLPCPFCGAKVEITNRKARDMWAVQCCDCGNSTTEWMHDKNAVIVSWNTRHTPKGYALIPIEPTEALLESMAVRYDHGLACPGYYDQAMFKSDISHKERLESTVRTMRQLHEEVVGVGFYKHDK